MVLMQSCFLFKRSQIICGNQQGVLELVKFSRELATLEGESGCFLPTRISRDNYWDGCQGEVKYLLVWFIDI